MGKTLYLHIGTPKTGTTTLQRFLVANQGRLASDHDLWYPMPSTVVYGSASHGSHVILPYSVLDTRSWPAFVPPGDRLGPGAAFGALQRDLDATTTSRILVSSEDFAIHGARVRAVTERVAALRGCSVRVIVYLRPQAEVLESLYAWNPAFWKQGRTLAEVAGDAPSARPRWLDYAEMLRPWRDALGDDAIDCRLVSELPGDDIVNGVLAGFGIEPAGFERRGRANVATRRGVVEFFRSTLPSIDPRHQAAFVSQLRPVVQKLVAADGPPRLRAEEAAWVMDGYSTANRTVARELLGREELFPGWEPCDPPESGGELLEAATIDRIVAEHWTPPPDAPASAWRRPIEYASRWLGTARRARRNVSTS